ncbi:NAD-P-binding protein [Irpex rosettiformis]|uniref:NAD-P-binding protein n=1 Tax=Irpex rosettiformis TaxID=378272 RepID=A0ACB8U6L0_9APHY|nr:NAD-P-binding protein [Irpex rosettiformis]
MRILVLGGTGPSGQLLIEEGLSLNHSIVVLARSPQKLPEVIRNHAYVTVIEGELTNENVIDKAMEGVDAVISALGPAVKKGPFHPSDTPLAKAYSLVIKVMKKHGVKRLIALGTASIKDEHDKFSAVFMTLVTGVAVFAHNAYKDVVAIGETIRGEGGDLSWTIVRVPILTEDSKRDVVAGYIGDGVVKPHLTRAAFAAFVLQQLDSKEWQQKAPLISSP